MEIPHVWPRCPEAAAFFERQFGAFATANPLLEQMAARFYNAAGVNILNLVDHWLLPTSDTLANELAAVGMVETEVDGESVWEHPKARFPRIRLSADQPPRLGLMVENIPLFQKIHFPDVDVSHSDAVNDYVEWVTFLDDGELALITRRGNNGFSPGNLNTNHIKPLYKAIVALHERRRGGSEAEVLAAAQDLLGNTIRDIGQARATDEFFHAERNYYMTRNAAARWQHEQQQQLGIGWANHDHHTYRSSRQSFRALMQLFLLMGFEMRERFYAGAEAGWGAQILEHPVSRVVIFADVDMAPDELDIDFANVGLEPRSTLGTIGLWCALHGSSIAAAGMHHLEAEFDFTQARANLEAAGFGVMPPFTDLPMLKQAFTQPEIWGVEPARIQTLRDAGSITPEQAAKFREHGAPGSHLEILQRWEGFKGFNKTGVSEIILATDARNSV